jgi:hypothetical protein
MTELSASARLGVFAAGLVVVLVASLGVGRLTGDVAQAGPSAPDAAAESVHGGGHGEGHEGSAATSGSLGTSLSSDGLRLEVSRTTLPPLVATPVVLRVIGEDGPITEFEVEQTKLLHLVLVSRDLSRHAHVHPEPNDDGSFTALLTLSPGSYRAVADFVTDGTRHSLGFDLATPGPLEVAPLPPPSTTAQAGPVRVELTREGDRLSFTAYDAAGAPVVPEPYLGARGHLVAFRAGDLAYTHLHPVGERGATTSYDAQLPGPGSYRLFLELQVDGTVRTAAFTLEDKR